MSCSHAECNDPVMKGLRRCPDSSQVKPIIACDVDDIVANLLGEWLSRYNEKYDDDLLPEEIHSWDIDRYVKPECGKAIYRFLSDPTLYDSVEPHEHALETVAELREIGHLIFVTSCEGEIQRDHKFRWLRRKGFLGDHQKGDYITCKDKWLIGADYLIDDGQHNVESFHRNGLLVTRPHNKLFELKRGTRIAAFEDAPAFLRSSAG